MNDTNHVRAEPSLSTISGTDLLNLLHAPQVPLSGVDVREASLLRCCALLGGRCGLRFGEIAALNGTDVDAAAGTLRVEHRTCPRVVPMHPMVRDALAAWARDYGSTEGGPVFTDRKGKRLTEAAFAPIWAAVWRNAGMASGPAPHFHALRHLAGSTMIKNGTPGADVAAILGHTAFAAAALRSSAAGAQLGG